MLPQPNTRLDLTQLHNAIHNYVLSRRESVGFWSGSFETAWAGFVFAGHSSDNVEEATINLIKGELLGEKNPDSLDTPVDVAAYYMSAAFFQKIGLTEVAVEFVRKADIETLNLTASIDLGERFHFFSTPEYLYALALSHSLTEMPMPEILANVNIELSFR
jgi:hypothetical protein